MMQSNEEQVPINLNAQMPWVLWGSVLSDISEWQNEILGIDRAILSMDGWGIIGTFAYLLTLDANPDEKYLVRRVFAPRKQLKLGQYVAFVKNSQGEYSGQYQVVSWDWGGKPQDFSLNFVRGQFTKL